MAEYWSSSTGQGSTSSVVSTNINNVTLAAWVKVDSGSIAGNNLIYNGNPSANGWGLKLNASDDNLHGLIGGKADFDAVLTITRSIWQHWVFVRDSGTSKVYMDGTAGSGSITTAPNTPSGYAFYLRHPDSDTNHHPTSFAEVAVWEVALNSAEIAALAKGFAPLRVRPSGLVHYAPLIRGGNERKGQPMTLTSNTVVEHPRIIY